MKISTIVRAAMASCAFIFSAYASAAPILLVDSNGILTGAKGVDVRGTLYDVTFADGSCDSLFNDCNPAAFSFRDANSAFLAADALLEQVLVDGPMGNFDTLPTKVYGCDKAVIYCVSLIPFHREFTTYDYTAVQTGGPVNYSSGYDLFFGGAMSSDFSTVLDYVGDMASLNYAIFQLSSRASDIPEPTSITLFGIAMACLAFSRRRKS